MRFDIDNLYLNNILSSDVSDMMLKVCEGNYLCKYINKERKVVKKELIYSSFFSLNSMIDDSDQLDVLVSPNPYSEEIDHNQEFFDVEENHIEEVYLLTFDIDYDFDTYAYDIIDVIINNIKHIERDSFVLYKTASGNIRIYILVEKGNLDIVDAIKVAKVLHYKICNCIKSICCINVDPTFAGKLMHPVFVEEKFIVYKDNKKSTLMYPTQKYRLQDSVKTNLQLFKDLLDEFEDIFGKKKKSFSGSNGSNTERAKKRKRNLQLSEKQIQSLEEQIELFNSGVFKANINRKEGIKNAGIGYLFKDIYNSIGKDIKSMDFELLRESKMYQDIYNNYPDHDLALLIYLDKAFTFFSEKLYKFSYYDHTYPDENGEVFDKRSYRFKNVIFPVIQTCVDIFSAKAVRNYSIYEVVLDILFSYSSKIDKKNLIQDIITAINYAEEYNDRSVDKDYQKKVNSKQKNYFYLSLLFIYDVIKRRIGQETEYGFVVSKKEIKDKYNFSKSDFEYFKTHLTLLEKEGYLSYNMTTRNIEIYSLTNPIVLYKMDLFVRKSIVKCGRFSFHLRPMFMLLEEIYNIDNPKVSNSVFSDQKRAKFNQRMNKILGIKRRLLDEDTLAKIYKSVLEGFERFIDKYIRIYKGFGYTKQKTLKFIELMNDYLDKFMAEIPEKAVDEFYKLADWELFGEIRKEFVQYFEEYVEDINGFDLVNCNVDDFPDKIPFEDKYDDRNFCQV